MATDRERDVELRPASDVDDDSLLRHVIEAWSAESVVAHDERIYPARLLGFVAIEGDRIMGHISYRIIGELCEITSIEATPRHAGIGTRLLEAATDAARAAGCRKAWLTTTNDNLDALRFYQRRGFRLSALRPGAADRARRSLKPEIPVMGAHGIPMSDELDLEMKL
jgi:ribosomal protein S18 acetylase RimI-like enzyme